MAEKLADQIVDALPWLDGLAEATGKALDPVLGPKGPKGVQDFLNGTWFGHPLHPAVVVLPLGAWTSMVFLDLAGMEEAADLNLKIGVVGALGAAATGAAQWQDTQGKPRRVGMLHAALNSVALLLVVVSWLLRARGSRRAGVAVSTAGAGISTVSAWLGGDLAYDLGIGVNRTAFEEPSADWVEVMAASDLQENTPKRVMAGGVPVMLLRQGEETFGISATCSHLGGPLDEGEIKDGTVTCPWHGSEFCLRDGAVIHGPATAAQPAFDVQERNGQIAVRARQG